MACHVSLIPMLVNAGSAWFFGGTVLFEEGET
jgi:hypothetical protein